MDTKIIPIILCGGSGQRLLPFLKYSLPKQFLNIFYGRGNLLQNTLLRFNNKNIFNDPIIVSSFNYRTELVDSLKAIQCKTEALIFEQDGRNTGPAITSVIAYLTELGIKDNTMIVIIPIDHYIADEKQFIKRLEYVAELLRNTQYQDKIMTLSVEKTATEANYGHLKVGKKQSTKSLDSVYEVLDFIEKPEHEMSEQNIVWNSGIYCMSIKSCKNIIIKNSPHIWHYSYKAVTKGIQRTLNSSLNIELLLNNTFFSKNSKLSFDQILTMPYWPESLICTDIGTQWEDIGLWSGIKRLHHRNQHSVPIINSELFAQQI